MAIKDAVGEWFYEENAVKGIIRSRFIEVYTSSLSSVPRSAPSILPWQINLDEEESQSIVGAISEVEIKAALWSLKAFKARVQMGFMRGFFIDSGWLWVVLW